MGDRLILGFLNRKPSLNTPMIIIFRPSPFHCMCAIARSPFIFALSWAAPDHNAFLLAGLERRWSADWGGTSRASTSEPIISREQLQPPRKTGSQRLRRPRRSLRSRSPTDHRRGTFHSLPLSIPTPMPSLQPPLSHPPLNSSPHASFSSSFSCFFSSFLSSSFSSLACSSFFPLSFHSIILQHRAYLISGLPTSSFQSIFHYRSVLKDVQPYTLHIL